MPSRASPPERTRATEGQLSIGSLSRATGIPAETLRTWELRYAFPVPYRKPSGHRLYPVSLIPRLARMAELLASGHRAGQVVGASDDELHTLLDAAGPVGPRPSVVLAPDEVDPSPLLDAVRAFDGERLVRDLQTDWARLGALVFVEQRIAPLLRAVGDQWSAGRLEVRHEHFLSEQLDDLLRSLRRPFDDRATGPLVVMATLPDERHGLGLQMAALVIASAGCRVLNLGSDTPVTDIARAAMEARASGAAISISASTAGSPSRRSLTRLRRLLPKRLSLVVGGDGAPAARPGSTSMSDLRALDDWARHR